MEKFKIDRKGAKAQSLRKGNCLEFAGVSFAIPWRLCAFAVGMSFSEPFAPFCG
ncbi:MAG: hypothetical protein PHX38_06375 [Sulfuricella sp.]|nr:hypothetical protein [Sulfuricella sp.]